MCVYVCVCASCVCCYRFAAAALALARSLFLSSTSYKHRKEHIDHMPLLPRVACQTTHLSTGCTLYTKVHVLYMLIVPGDQSCLCTYWMTYAHVDCPVDKVTIQPQIAAINDTKLDCTLWLVMPVKHTEISHWTLFTRRTCEITRAIEGHGLCHTLTWHASYCK